MTRRLLLAVALAASCVSTPAFAQAIRFVSQSPDCNLAARRFDNPFSDHAGWWMRRYQWHAFYAGVSSVSAELLHRTTHLPRWASALSVTLAIGLVPHIRSTIIERHATINPRDWAFDLFTRSAPLVAWTGASGHTWQSKTLAVTTYTAGYLAGACYASP